MDWENLQTFTCPHCTSPLERGELPADEITCTKCRFHIAPRRFEAIIEHRHRGTPPVRMKWQNLHASKCPISTCERDLRPSEGHLMIQRCASGTCPFKITDAMLETIMQDPEHPANRYHS